MAKGHKSGNEINWDAVRERYIEGATWKQLEDEFSISRGAIHQHRKEEEWDRRKAERHAEIAKKVQNNHVRSTVKDMGEFNRTCEESAEIACKIAKHLIVQMYKSLAQNNIEPDPKKLLDLIKINRESLDMKRLINNIAPPQVTDNRTAEFDAYQVELARLAHSHINGDPLDLTKTTVIKIEPPKQTETVN